MNCHGYHLAMAAPSTVNAATQTLLQLATPATRRGWWKTISVSGKDTDGTKVPPLVDLIRQTSAGAGSTAVTPRPLVAGHPASLCTALERPTSEPSNGGLIIGGPWYVTSVGGLFVLQIPLGEEIEQDISDRIGLRITTAGTITGVIACVDFSE